MSERRPSKEGDSPSASAAGGATRRVGWAGGLLCGAAGGGAAAALDYARALPELGRHLPDGSARVLCFLLCLYAGALAVLGLVLALGLELLCQLTPLGPLLRRERAQVPRRAIVGAALLSAAALGAALYGPALLCLLRFHHRTLIALLVGAVAAGLLLPAAGLGLLLSAALARLPWFSRGKQAAVGLGGPPGLYAVGWAAGLLLCAGAVAVALERLQLNHRMTQPLRALNLCLWAPALALACVGLGHGAGRLLAARRLPAGLLRLAETPVGTAALALCTLAAPLSLFAAGYRETLRLLDLRPLTSLTVAALVGLGLALAGLRRGRRAALLLLLPLWLGALWLGQGDRVRKGALSQAALAGPIVAGLHAVFDLDRDGYPSRWVVGGSDCDDLRADVHPEAFDWPDDGVDQNCNGHQARMPDERRPPPPPLPPGLPPRPSLLLITIDALRADHMGSYGYQRPTTPALDALAREGALFASAWAHAPSTRYSVPAILTGRYPSTIAWGPPSRHWPPEVLPENRLLSEMLQERGYHTTALLSYHYFEPTWGLAQGFADYDYHLMTLHSQGGDPAATSGTSARELADLAIQKLAARADKEAPFFLWVHFYDPHYRYEVHPGVPVFGTGRAEQDLYDGEIRYTDQHIGRLLDALRRTDDWARTIVAVTADHGEGFGEHGIPPDRRHGYHLYADQTKVPLILRVPGLPPRRIAAPVGHIDLVPTLLQLCGGQIEREPQLLGESAVDLLAGAEGGERQVFQEVMYEGPTVRKALVTRRWHLIRNVIPDGTSELYELSRDPQEEHDLQGGAGSAAAERELSQRLAAWMDQSALPADFKRRIADNLSSSPLAATQPIGAILDDALEVVGADVRGPQVGRGGTAEVAVVLRVRRRIGPGWRMFTHLVSAGGGFVNADHDLLDGLVPLQQLRPGQYVRDEIRIPIPPTWPVGPATLQIGLFSRTGRAKVAGPPQRIDEGQRMVRAATLVVR